MRRSSAPKKMARFVFPLLRSWSSAIVFVASESWLCKKEQRGAGGGQTDSHSQRNPLSAALGAMRSE